MGEIIYCDNGNGGFYYERTCQRVYEAPSKERKAEFDKTVWVISRFYANTNISEEARNYNYLKDTLIDTRYPSRCGIVFCVNFRKEKSKEKGPDIILPYPVTVYTRWGRHNCFDPIYTQFRLRKLDPTVVVPDYRELFTNELGMVTESSPSEPGSMMKIHFVDCDKYAHVKPSKIFNESGLYPSEQFRRDEDEHLIDEWKNLLKSSNFEA